MGVFIAHSFVRFGAEPIVGTRMRKIILAAIVLTLAGCVSTSNDPSPKTTRVTKPKPSQAVSQNPAERRFMEAVNRIEPIATRICRSRTTATKCSFKFVLVDNKDKEKSSGAYQGLDKHGRPVITFTYALLAAVRNQDELALVLGHEVAHHIHGHIPKTIQRMNANAVAEGLEAAKAGAGDAEIQKIQRKTRARGALKYSKKFELQADALGTIIAARAGYDPIRGAAILTRIADPGNRVLSSHPPNRQRITTVRNTVANM